jgi:hypothetical protein
MEEDRVGKFGTPYRSPSVKDLLRQRKLILNKLQRARVQVRACGRVIEALKQKFPLDETVARLHLDVQEMQRLAEEQAAYAAELTVNLGIAQARLRETVTQPAETSRAL